MISIDTNLLLYSLNRPGVARRHIFDARLAHTLLDHGVREFATRNTRDFEGFGFERIFDPLRGAQR